MLRAGDRLVTSSFPFIQPAGHAADIGETAVQQNIPALLAAVAGIKGALPSPAEYFEVMRTKVLPAAGELYRPLDFAGMGNFSLGYAGDK